MDEKDEETSIIEASGDKDESDKEINNSFGKAKSSNGTKRHNEDPKAEGQIKKKKFCPQYIFQQDYEEALRSLLWEPYDCRDDFNPWCYEGLDDEPRAVTSEVSQKMFFSSSDSSLTSYSSCSSVDEALAAETKKRSALNLKRSNSLSVEMSINVELSRECKKRMFCSGVKELGKNLKEPKTIQTSALLVESNLSGEEEQFCVFSESKCTTDPVQNQMNIGIMVSDLHFKNGDGVSSYNERREARKLHSTVKGASACQYKLGCCFDVCDECDGKNNNLNATYKMLVTVEGTLEPRDSNEGTQLVSPDTSLDLNDNSVRSPSSGRTEPAPSGGNVSVVNCYRAVPVSVVSTVPTIKCLNTQESIANVNIIQTSLNSDPKLATTKHPQTPSKRQTSRTNIGPVASTSRVRTKVPGRDVNKAQIGHCVAVEQNETKDTANVERLRSVNVCASEKKSELSGQPSSLSETSSTVSNNSNLAISSHNQSVPNPVLGNQVNSMQNKFGSQQNVAIRLETHFGPNSPDDAEHSQTYLMQRSLPIAETSASQPEVREAENEPTKPSLRTFTSTEAQTDDVPLNVHSRTVINREQRRRERRERRHQRRLHQNVLSSGNVWQTNVDIMHRDRRALPDILNSHMPPPYSAVSLPVMPTISVPPIHVPPPMPVPAVPQTVPHLVESLPGRQPHQNSFRFPFTFSGGGRRGHGQVYSHEDETPKSCCGVVVTQTVSIRWFIVMISFVGICCVIVGTVLGAMKASGREHLTVSLLMIGVGIVLVTVSVVAWRLTSQDAPSCRSMLGLRNADDSGNEPNQRFVPRMPPNYGRPHHPYAAMMYPEFQYRPPPPSYQASMQEYRLRLLLLERPNDTAAGLQAAISPPPTYRSQAGSTLGLRPPPLCRSLPQSEYSHPPSYRSRTSSTRPTLDPNGDSLGSVNHSRNSSLLSHVSDQNGNVSQAVVNVISVMGNTVDLRRGDTELQIESIKLGVEEEVGIPPLRMLLNKGKRSPALSLEETKSENVNLVTIVTVSDSNNTAPTRDHSVESDVLAHL